MIRKEKSLNQLKVETKAHLMLVDPIALDHVWERAEMLLSGVEDYTPGKFTLPDIYEMVQRGLLQLWLCHDAVGFFFAFVTHFVDYPRKRTIRFCMAGGSRAKECLPLLPLVENWALSHGCTGGEVVGRKGWAKLLEMYGYTPIAPILFKYLRVRMN